MAVALDDLRGLALDDSRHGLCSRFGVVALRSLPDDLRGLALDDPGVNGCGGAVVVGLLLLDSVGGSPDDSGRGFVGRCCGSLAGFSLEFVDSVGGSPDDSGHGVGVDFSSCERLRRW